MIYMTDRSSRETRDDYEFVEEADNKETDEEEA